MDYFVSDKKEKKRRKILNKVNSNINTNTNINKDNNNSDTSNSSPLVINIDDTNANPLSMEKTKNNIQTPKKNTSTNDTITTIDLVSSPTVQPIVISDNEEEDDTNPILIQSPITKKLPQEKDYQDLLLLTALSDYENTISEADAMISMSENRRFLVNIYLLFIYLFIYDSYFFFFNI